VQHKDHNTTQRERDIALNNHDKKLYSRVFPKMQTSLSTRDAWTIEDRQRLLRLRQTFSVLSWRRFHKVQGRPFILP
jgi:hypothetical protein